MLQITRLQQTLSIFALVFLCSNFLNGQDTIRGMVYDNEAYPMPYVNIAYFKNNVLVKGTETDKNGAFTLMVDKTNEKAKLQFSYLGYQTVEEEIEKGDTDLGVIMETNRYNLEEIMVISYHTWESFQFSTGCFQMIKTDPPKKMPDPTPTISAFNIYPNITKDIVNIETAGMEGQKLHVSNNAGTVLKSIFIDEDVEQINLLNLPAGMYYFSSNNGQDTFYQGKAVLVFD